MKKPLLRVFYFIFCFAVFSGCDQGLAPEPPPQYGIAGNIYFKNWPPPDSVLDLRLVAFKNYPSGDIVSEVLQGKARFTSTLGPYGADTISYLLLLSPLPPGIYEYIAVAQQFGSNLFRDWRPVGVYRNNTGDMTRPGSLFVPANQIVQGIDIKVDFRNPPQPP